MNIKNRIRINSIYLSGLILAISLFTATGNLYAQQETEVFIPLGKSPGVSGKSSVTGRIESVNPNDSTIVITQSSGNKTVRVSSFCKIYLDKSRMRLTNSKGRWADLKKGALCEIKYNDPKKGLMAEWVKIQQ